MKRLTAWLITLALLCVGLAFAQAEDTAEYSDSVYRFRYPAAWRQGTARDGTIILEVTGTADGVMTFGILTDLIAFTGDKAQDAPLIEGFVGQYTGESSSNLRLSGEYESFSVKDFTGFRADGKWAGKQRAEMIYLSGGGSLILFIFVGDGALAQEDAILSSVEVAGKAAPAPGDDPDYTVWQGAEFSLLYPKAYGTMEQTGGVIFLKRGENPSDIIAARAYALDFDYSDALAPAIAAAYLPKSTHVEAVPEMQRVGQWNAAVIRGDMESGPVAFYVVGSGRTALGLLFTGEEAVGHAETMVASVQLGQ